MVSAVRRTGSLAILVVLSLAAFSQTQLDSEARLYLQTVCSASLTPLGTYFENEPGTSLCSPADIERARQELEDALSVLQDKVDANIVLVHEVLAAITEEESAVGDCVWRIRDLYSSRPVRVQVATTLMLRREKGTLKTLEELVNDITGWRPECRLAWQLGSGWQAVDIGGELVLAGEGESYALLRHGSGLSDYSLYCSIEGSGIGLQISFRVTRDQGRYFIAAAENSLILFKEAPWGVFTPLARAQANLPEDERWSLRIDVVGPEIEVYVDSHRLIHHTDVEPLLTLGTVAFEVLRGSAFLVDDVIIFFAGSG